MDCAVYRGSRKSDTYLFVERPGEFQRVPELLLQRLGELELTLEIELYPGRRLVRTDAETVIAALRKDGYYLQLPPRHPIGGVR